MTAAKYQRRRFVVRAEIVDGSSSQAKRFGYTRRFKKGETGARRTPEEMILKIKQGPAKKINIGDYIVYEGARGYVHYTPTEFNQEWEPFNERIEAKVVDDADPKMIDKNLDFCILIGDPRSETPDFAFVGGPHAAENTGRIVESLTRPDK